MPGPVEATSSTLEVAHEDSVCHKIMKMNLQCTVDDSVMIAFLMYRRRITTNHI
jgi:hypothetical protein